MGSTVNVFPSKISPLYFSLLMIPITLDVVHGFPFIVVIPCSFNSLAIIVLPAPATYLSKIYLTVSAPFALIERDFVATS